MTHNTHPMQRNLHLAVMIVLLTTLVVFMNYVPLYAQIQCTADFVAQPISGCATLVVIFYDNSSNAGQWQWNFPGGTPSVASGQGPHIVKYYSPGGYDVELAILCKQGSHSIKKEKYIKVYDCTCMADFTADPTYGCPGTKVTFTDNSNGAASWSWSFPGGNPSSASGNGPHEVTYDKQGKYDVGLTIQCKQGSDTETKKEYINIMSCQCIADFTGSPASGCAPLNVEFTDNSTGALSWSWTFPGGTPSNATGKGPHTVTYYTPGKHDVELAIQCINDSDIEKKQYYIDVMDCACQADFTAQPTSGCAPLKVKFTDNSTAADHWWWRFPGGTPATATGKGPHEVLYNWPGKYDVTLDIACENNKDSITKTKLIDVDECQYDFGDAPDPDYPTKLDNDGARHIINPKIYLGESVDPESDGQPNEDASGDDTDQNDDDDGVSFEDNLVRGDTAVVKVKASTNGHFKGWIDFNIDGDWDDPGETVLDQQVSGGINELLIIVPVEAKKGRSFARFRFSTGPVLSYRDLVENGEVEDYMIMLYDRIPLPGEYGDAPEGALAYPALGVDGRFPTCKHVGPSGYVVHGTRGKCYLGWAVDYELDGNGGNCPTFERVDYDSDEFQTSPGVWGEDGGLLRPQTFTIYCTTDSCRVTSFGPQIALGKICGIAQWGRDIDIHYKALGATETSYLNVLIDWNQDGRWGGTVACGDSASTNEHVLIDLPIPAGTQADVSTLAPPDFRIGPNPGYVWARFTISDAAVSRYWDGSGRFTDGETEDHLLLIHDTERRFEFGDAPENVLAYPSTGQIGNFPTCKWSGFSSYIQHRQGYRLYLGDEPDLETDGNSGYCPTFSPQKYNRDWDNDILLVENFNIIGAVGFERVVSELVTPMSSLNETIGTACQTGSWGTAFDFEYHNYTGTPAYLNVLIDWDQNGVWSGSSSCSGAAGDAPEHILVNFSIRPGRGNVSGISPPSFRIGPNSGYVWARFSITESPVELPWNGSGNFEEGETEDFLLKVGGRHGLFDYGDAPLASYGTRSADNGAFHMINPNIYLGSGVDGEEDGQPDQDALGDDKNGSDDEDGVTFKRQLMIGDTAVAQVIASGAGMFKGWIDYNQDGDWDDPGETTTDYQTTPGTNEVLIIVPADAKPGRTYARFRFSDSIIERYDGPGSFGEVEDYMVEMFERLPIPREYGDAPEGVVAYPDLGVSGRFPTCKDAGPAGYVRHGTLGEMYFGYEIDYELDGNAGSCPISGADYDADEGLNEYRDGITIYRDIGLLDPICYTISGEAGSEYYWPYSIFRSRRGVLGENCGLAEWGTHIDAVYHVTRDEGAYVNVLIDWNQDGQWGGRAECPGGTVYEHVLSNFHVPKGEGLTGHGRLSDLGPPAFTVGPNPGYVWVRFTISERAVPPGWSGEENFSDGETEDYLLCTSRSGFFDYGDAPEGALAYPSTGVFGRFPTCRAGGPAGHIRHGYGGLRYFGGAVDYEMEGNAGFCPAFTGRYDADENYYNEMIVSDMRDAGLLLVMPYTISGAEGFQHESPYVRDDEDLDLARSLGGICSIGQWGTDIDIQYRILERPPEDYAHINVMIDWNQDGEWGGSVDCSGESVDEHVLRNFRVTGFGVRFLSGADPPDFRIGPHSGYVWARFTITKEPVPDSWDGTGIFEDGETEDYLLYISHMMVFDYGDVPWLSSGSSDDDLPAFHAVHPGFFLGDTVDSEPQSLPDEHARGDDDDNIDDEDGVVFPELLIPGREARVLVKASLSGVLNAWIDFDGDSSWADTGEQIIQNGQLTQGPNSLTFAVPALAMRGVTFARFRFSDRVGISFGGPNAGDPQDPTIPIGEVEDYEIYVGESEEGLDYGDVPDPNYPTLLAQNGARHVVDPKIYLGSKIDTDTDGQPDWNAQGDDMDGIDDDEGVMLASPVVPGNTVTMTVTASTNGHLNAWMDWNGDGDWLDANEHVFMDVVLAPGAQNLTFNVPALGAVEKVFARFRFSTVKGLSFNGLAPDGEVEDYMLQVVTTDVRSDYDAERMPTEYELLQNYPNPFNPETTIEFHMPNTGDVVLQVFDIKGHEVRRLIQATVSPGQHRVVWDGRDALGQLAATGMYFYRIEVRADDRSGQPFVQVKKMLFLK